MRAKHQERVRKQEEALEESQARGGGRGREPAGSGDAAGQQDRLYLQAMDQMIARRKANEARTAERADQALAQCTFRPVVNAKSKPLALPGTAFERLWDNAQQQRAKREQLEKRRREEEEQAVSSDCTFRPNIDAKSKAMSNARVAALRTNKITVFDQLAQDADRRRMRQEEFSLYMPPEATFAPEINDRSKVMASVVMQAVKEGASPTASKSEGASEGGSPQKGPLGKSQVSRMARVKEEMEALQKIDAKTGKPLFKPETGRANVGRELEKGGLPIGDYLYQKELERRQKMEVLAKDTEARRQAVASRRPNASSQRYLEALRGRRFKQVFFYLLQNLGPASGAKGAPAIDMDPLLVPGNPVMESMDGEVRADVEAAAQLLLAKGRSPVKGRSPKKAPRPLATEEVFTALMQEVIATSTIKSRTYLLPVSRQRATDENLTFRPRINPRSKEMAEARRPVGARLEDLLTDEQKLRNARAKAREEEIQQSRMKDCTFAPKLNENRSKEGRAFKEAAARARRTGGPSDAVPMDGDGSGAYGDIEAEVLEALDRAKLGGGPNAPGKVISLRGFPVDDIVGTLEGVDAAVADVAATAGPAGGAAAQGKGASGLLESLQQQLDAIQGQAGGTSEKLKMAWDSDDDA
ncbi:unnamed protein product [Pedinophyceae sp. YPF-701]|nr:unnamed protein product [Pedinophyceae sp. YPF-701]